MTSTQYLTILIAGLKVEGIAPTVKELEELMAILQEEHTPDPGWTGLGRMYR